MKHAVVFGLLFGLLIAFPGMARAAETSLGMELWSRWTMISGTSPADSSSSQIKNNSIALERGYLDLKTKFTELTSARFTVDMFSTDTQKDGAGLKLKYAFMDFDGIIPIPDARLSVGLQKVYFGSIYDWDYTLIGKAPSDEYKLANSADYGISVNGYLPSGWGEYALGVYNGDVYKNFGSNLKENTSMEFLANLRLTPITGLTLGGSFMTNSVEREKALATDIPVSGYQTQNLIDALARLAFGPAILTVEYLSKAVEYPNVSDGSKDYNASGISIIPILNLRHYIDQDVQLLARYDRWDETDNASNKHLLQAITGGINYNLMHNESYSPALQLQLNATHKSYDAEKSAASYDHKLKDNLTVMAQLKWRFSHKL